MIAVLLAALTFQQATATAYSTREHLEGCQSPGRCRTACGSWLDDRAFTVAANPRLNLGCGQRLIVCRPVPRLCHRATVTDRTASGFGFEVSVALAAATGRTGAAWDAPRTVLYRVIR